MTTEETFFNGLLEYSGKISTFFMIIPVLIYLYFRKNQQKYSYIYFIIILLDWGVSLFEQLFVSATKIFPKFKDFIHSIGIDSTNWIIILTLLYIYLLHGYFYNNILPKQIGRYIFNFSIILTIISIFIYFKVDGYNNQPTLNAPISVFYNVIIPLIGIRILLKEKLNQEIFKNSYFLISLAILIPAVFTLFSIFNSGIYSTNFNLFVKLSILRNTLNLLQIYFLSKAFYKPKFYQ